MSEGEVHYAEEVNLHARKNSRLSVTYSIANKELTESMTCVYTVVKLTIMQHGALVIYLQY